MEILVESSANIKILDVIKSARAYEEKIIKKLMNTDFEKMKEFFRKKFFEFKDNQCIVLVTRRCLLLAIWFLQNLYANMDNSRWTIAIVDDCLCIIDNITKKKNYIINDNGIFLLDNLITKDLKKIIVLDDVVIHGRHLKTIKKTIEDKVQDKKISVEREVFLKSVDTCIEDVEYAEKYVTKDEWTILSEQIVNAIALINIPYVSYINSWSYNNCSIEDFERIKETLINNGLNDVQFEDRTQLATGRIAIYFEEKNFETSASVFSKIVRLYYNKHTKVCNIIPYVEIAIPETLEDSELSGILEYVFSDEKNVDKNVQKNVLSCIFSNNYSKEVFNKYLKDEKISGKWLNDIYDCLIMSFGKKLSQKILSQEVDDLLNKTIEYNLEKNKVVKDKHNEQPLVIDDSMILKVNKYINNYSIIRWIKREYITLINKKDLSRLNFQDLYNDFLERHKIQIDCQRIKSFILICIMHLCDIGRMSISFNKSSNKVSQINVKSESRERGNSLFETAQLEVGEMAILTVRDSIMNSEIKKIEDEVAIKELELLFTIGIYKKGLAHLKYIEK